VIALDLGLPALCFVGAGFALLGAIMILTVARSG
jgi:hypothetical protein